MISGLVGGAFDILVTMKGYKSYHQNLSFPVDTKIFSVAPIILQTEYQELRTFVVHQVQSITIKKDTVEYHAQAYAMREESMLADLLKKLPGITLNPDSSITRMGKKIVKILVDGKEFFELDAREALQHIPSDLIEKIQVIDDYGDQARLTGVKTGEPKKVLNIELKKDKRNGQLGSAEGEIGNKDQYSAILVANAFSSERRLSLISGINNSNPFGRENIRYLKLSYADRWSTAWSGSGDGNLIATDHQFENITIQDFNFFNGYTHQEQDNITRGNKQQQQLNYEFIYTPALNTLLRINASFKQQSSKETEQITQASTETDSGFHKAGQSFTINQSDTRNISMESKAYFEKAYSRSGLRFSLDANLKYTPNQHAGDNLTQSQIQSDSFINHSLQHYRIDNVNKGWDMAAAIHYYIPLGTGRFLETSYSLHHVLTESSRNTQQPNSSAGNWQIIDSLSNNYNFRTTIQSLQVGYTRHSNKTDMDLSLLSEPGTMEGRSTGKGTNQSYHYFNVLPRLAFSYSFNPVHKISLSYSTIVSPPELQQVQPVTDLGNPQYPVTGNPKLRPALNRTLALNYDHNSQQPTRYQGFGIGISYTPSQDMIIPNIVHSHDTSTVVQQTYFENVKGSYVINLNWRFDLLLLQNKRLKIAGWGTLNKNHGVSMEDHILQITNTLNINQNLNLQYSVPDQVEVNIFFSHNYSLIRYISTDNLPVLASTMICGMTSRNYFSRNWTLSYEFIQNLSGGGNPSLSSRSAILNIHLHRSFLKRKKLSCSFSANNILNSNLKVSQSVTSNTITQNRAILIGQTFLFKAKWSFECFKKPVLKG